MLKKRFEPVEGRNQEIIETVMNCSDVDSLPENIKFKIRLCVEEVEENILCYSGTTWVELGVWIDNSQLNIRFRDGGVEFNPLDNGEPDLEAPVEKRQIGGLGILICKKMMSEIVYTYKDRSNSLLMKLNLNA
ncbi:MAG: ATP-binding protein [Bacteroidales bacterium]|nr:ATP-binding protein [Bacteroidales bacterium]